MAGSRRMVRSSTSLLSLPLPLPRLTLTRALRLLHRGLLSSEELCSYCHALAVAGEEEWHLNAFTHLTPLDALLEEARASDERRRRRNNHNDHHHGDGNRGVLEGIPISLKANLAVSNQCLTAASRILNDGHPCGYHADVTSRLLLQRGGAILLGVTNMDEFGMGSLGNMAAPCCVTDSTVTRNPIPYLSHIREHHDENDNDDWRVAERLRSMSVDQIRELHANVIILNNEKDKVVPTTTTLTFTVRSAGGSSCGSAASVAHGSSLVSLGTDTGGSVRLPAAWCHVVGLKPSYGLLSRHGVVSYASSLDTVGIVAPSVDCAGLVLHVLAQKQQQQQQQQQQGGGERGGEEEEEDKNNEKKKNHTSSSRDSTASFYPPSSRKSVVVSTVYNIEDNDDDEHHHDDASSSLSGLKVGIPSAFSVAECPTCVRDAWARAADWLEDRGATIVTVGPSTLSTDLVQHSLAAYYVLACAEASSNLSRYDGFRYGRQQQQGRQQLQSSTNNHNDNADDDDDDDVSLSFFPLEAQYAKARTNGFGSEVIRRILCGTFVLSSDRFHTHYEAAAKLRALLTQQLNRVFATEADVLLLPTALSFPPSLDEDDDDDEGPDRTEMLANDVMTVPVSLAGLPSISVPVFTNNNINNKKNNQEDETSSMVGLQVVGSRLSEATVLQVARVIEHCNQKEHTTTANNTK